VNTDAPWPDADTAWWRVQGIQTKLHQWATDDPDRRFDDLWNLVYDPAVLADAWHRVRSNRGARSAGVDGETVHYVSVVRGEQAFLSELRDDLKARRFQPVPVREVIIPKPGGKRRRLGIATVRDRVVQAALKTVLEPIFEADCVPRTQRRSRCRSSSPTMRCCTGDGGRPSGAALQGEAPNHRKLRRSKPGW
jgi:RNA-directed DNA polymerase